MSSNSFFGAKISGGKEAVDESKPMVVVLSIPSTPHKISPAVNYRWIGVNRTRNVQLFICAVDADRA
jgi:hypothetical protein